MKKILSYIAVPGIMLMLMPFMVSAQDLGDGSLKTFFNEASAFINVTLIPVLLAVAFLVFIIGAVRFFLLAGKDNEDGQKAGKSLMLWGIIAFVLIVSIWGIVALFSQGLGLNEDVLKNKPKAPASR